MKKFELIVPAYNESKNLALLVKRAAESAQKESLTSKDFQFVIVNNGSQDNSKEVLKELSQNSQYSAWFRVVNIEINQGYGYGVLQGLKSTEAAIIGWSHADMQCDPADAIKAYKIISSAANSEKIFIKGVRSGRDWKDRFVSLVFQLMGRIILGLNTNEINAQPKVFPRQLLDKISEPPFNFAFDLYVLYQAEKNKYSINKIPVLFPPRIHGVSNWASNFFSRYKTIFGIINYMLDLRKKEGPL